MELTTNKRIIELVRTYRKDRTKQKFTSGASNGTTGIDRTNSMFKTGRKNK